MSITFAKGHGTGNDFVIIPDDAGQLLITAAQVRRITDRRKGIGADGILRVVPTALAGDTDVAALADVAPWFMDYRNADGSIAEMCGNGVRVFAHFLRTTGRVTADEFIVATRGGAKHVRVLEDDHYSVAMGLSHPISSDAPISVRVGGHVWTGSGVELPNPHAVVFVESLDDAGALLEAPTIAPAAAYPHGANVEFAVEVADRHVAMRVFERGVGETLSCGTGACAVAWAARRRAEASGDTSWRVDVPGGTLTVDEDERGMITLSGPAEIVATGVLSPDMWIAE